MFTARKAVLCGHQQNSKQRPLDMNSGPLHTLSRSLRVVSSCLIACVASTSGSPGAARLVVTYLGQQHPEQLEQQQQLLLAAFLEHVAGAKIQQSDAALSAYQPLFAHMSRNDFDTFLLPALLKMVISQKDKSCVLMRDLM